MVNSSSVSAAQSLRVDFFPLLEWAWLWPIFAVAIFLAVLSFFSASRALLGRIIVTGFFVLLLLGPSILEEERNYVDDVAVVVVDESYSQSFGQRTARTQKALAHIKDAVSGIDGLQLREVHAPSSSMDSSDQTELFSMLDQALADVPKSRRAGVVFITDGQIHDVPKSEEIYNNYGPVHALLSGEKSEKDRQVVILNAPAYGLVGKKVDVKYRIEDTQNIGEDTAEVTLTLHDGSSITDRVAVGVDHTISVPLQTPSENFLSLSVEGVRDEITLVNNKRAIFINGVRDRLKVLLISGIPHSGERTWRDLLTSDPGVDLVHFTILREPEKFDYTPKDELSLIAFPFRELFEIKLYDFDLIIFDQYRVNHILPFQYFENIAEYVKNGGAFLAASGPSFANEKSIYKTPLREILPAHPSGEIFDQAFVPQLTDVGHSHPVTQSIVWKGSALSEGQDAQWGEWLRYIDIEPDRGDVLMHAMDDRPLLVLDRMGKGRVAQLSSDHIWLWSRGYDGGGPHVELLRRIIHWLMKEPELDERSLDVVVNGLDITVRKRAINSKEENVLVTTPSGENEILPLTLGARDVFETLYKASEPGVYAFEQTDGLRKFAVIGSLDPKELRAVKTTDEMLMPLVKASSGGVVWLQDDPAPSVRAYKDARRYGGNDWIAFKKNDDYSVSQMRERPFLPEWLSVLLLLTLLIGMWWRESR